MPKIHKLAKLLDQDIRRKNIAALNLAFREKWWRFHPQTYHPPIFLVGCSRAGTTVTYETLAAAPGLKSFGYELPQFWDALYGPHHNDWASEAADAACARPEFRNRFLSYCYARLGPGRILDKTCINVMRIPFLNALFPDATFVYIHRDGRENISSMIDGWKDGRFDLGQFLGAAPTEVAIDGGRYSHWHFFLPPGWRDYNTASLEHVCAYQWLMANRLALDAKKIVSPERWIEIRYEEIVDRPVELFRHVFVRSNLAFTPEIEHRCGSMSDRPTSLVTGLPSREKWKQRNGDLIERIMPLIKPMMAELGRQC